MAKTDRQLLPTLEHEHALLADGYTVVVGMDEVGRGCLAGPASVGAVAIRADVGSPPAVRDSKLLTASARTALVPAVIEWAHASGVGHASNDEIDAHGIVGGLRLAGERAIAALGLDARERVIVLLDGSHNWLSRPGGDLLGLLDDLTGGTGTSAVTFDVTTVVKGDMTCAAIAAASVLAKVERDAQMVALSSGYETYGWAANKGYASPAHIAALTEHGPTPLHRRSWKLPGVVN